MKSLIVVARSNRRTALLRTVGPELYPGDACNVFVVPYFVDDSIFENRADAFQQPVKATLYRPGFLPVTAEKPFDEMQNF